MDKKKTSRYSAGRGEFTGYVINPEGTITSVFEGNLRNRAKSKELLEAVAKASGGSGSKESGEKAGSDSK